MPEFGRFIDRDESAEAEIFDPHPAKNELNVVDGKPNRIAQGITHQNHEKQQYRQREQQSELKIRERLRIFLDRRHHGKNVRLAWLRQRLRAWRQITPGPAT